MNRYTQKNIENIAYWMNILIKTASKVPQNNSDLIIQNCETKVCTMVEFSCPLDINTTKKVSEKFKV